MGSGGGTVKGCLTLSRGMERTSGSTEGRGVKPRSFLILLLLNQNDDQSPGGQERSGGEPHRRLRPNMQGWLRGHHSQGPQSGLQGQADAGEQAMVSWLRCVCVRDWLGDDPASSLRPDTGFGCPAGPFQ